MPKDPAFTQFYAATQKIYFLWLSLGWVPTFCYILDAVAIGRPTSAITTANGDIMRGITTSLTGALYVASVTVAIIYQPQVEAWYDFFHIKVAQKFLNEQTQEDEFLA